MISLVSGIPESSIRVKTHDIGGGFGGKVPVYPGYVIAIVASLTLGRPVKWIEDRSENLQADSFARDYHVHAELGLQNDGKMTGLRVQTPFDHGYADAAADPSKYPAGLFNVITGKLTAGDFTHGTSTQLCCHTRSLYRETDGSRPSHSTSTIAPKIQDGPTSKLAWPKKYSQGRDSRRRVR